MELPIGYRFKPTEEELVVHYLFNKACCRDVPAEVVPEIEASQIYNQHPKSSVSFPYGEKECYFFIQEDDHFHGTYPEAIIIVADGIGFWKPSGEEKPIYIKGHIFAFRKHLIYFSGSIIPEAKKTHWKMDLYRLPNEFYTMKYVKVKKWVLGRLKRGVDYTSRS